MAEQQRPDPHRSDDPAPRAPDGLPVPDPDGHPPPPPRPWTAWLRALVIGAGGGAAAHWIGLPLAWMVGSMLTCTVAALMSLRRPDLSVAVPMPLRRAMIAILGVMLGAGFTPEILARMADWWATVAGLVVYVLISSTAAVFYCQRLAGLERTTGFFSGMPGGLGDMLVLIDRYGGNARVMAIMHGVRIMLLVIALPWILQLFEGPIDRSSANRPIGDDRGLPGGLDILILASCAVVGVVVAMRLRLPAAQLVGPLILSAAVHLAGVTEAAVPEPLVAVAQIVIGGAIGCRFAGSEWQVLRKVFVMSLGLIALLLVLCVTGGWLLHLVTGVPIAACILAFAPGGLAEMTLIALAMQIDPAFIATHHILRIVMLVLFAPLAFSLLYGPPPESPDEADR